MQPIYTVSEMQGAINHALAYTFAEVVVEGELANYKTSQDKWAFFDIKDADAVIGCFLPLYMQRAALQDGMMVRVYAKPNVTKWGKFSLTIRAVELVGEGSVKQSFDALRAKLEKEGLFSLERKRSLPQWPKHIALITSKSAAAYNDFLTILQSRTAGMQIDHLQVQVQGEAATDQVVNAIEYCSAHKDRYDVVVLIRGGGSPEDLQVFQTEDVARAIYRCKVPTLVAIGHEDDICLAELAADVRAATPTDAAQRVSGDKRVVYEQVSERQAQIYRDASAHIDDAREHVVSFFAAATSKVVITRESLNTTCQSIAYNTTRQIEQTRGQIDLQLNAIRLLEPKAILRRGYAIVLRGDTPLQSIADVETGQSVVIQLSDGTIKATVD